MAKRSSNSAPPTVADTLCDVSIETPIPAQPIDPPTITVTFGINDSPLAGRDGKKVQSRVIRDRLNKEAEVNVAIKIDDTPQGDAFEVSGRGELQMGVLIENMRREGFAACATSQSKRRQSTLTTNTQARLLRN